MKKIRLFSTKITKGIEGEECELYVNFYLVLNKTYIFTFLINAPNLSCSDRHPIKLWKLFLILLEEETVKYMRRYETCINRGQIMTREDAIRREDALQALCKAVHKNDDTIPCPNQRESCLWSKTKVQDYAREIWKLPPVTPQPKTGHWIYKQYGGYPEQGDWYCSKCDYKFNFGHGYAEYCPKCGCKMSEAPTEEVKRI